MEDSTIVELYFARSEEAIAETDKKYGKYCNYIAYNILRSSEDAEECVNDAYMRAWNAIPPQRPVQLSTYLGKITRNLALNRYKGRNAQKRGEGQVALALSELEECVGERSEVETLADEMAVVEVINQFLARQSRLNRIVFVKRYWYLCSVKEIAEEFSMNPNRITSMLFRMRKELKKSLESEGIVL
ncbi:MAG: sigma-70 family RNA polymerase sigma factor [Emergencia sp.]|uniref:Sigma-70 family RNA polymerase sigma factor n=1 Tax=Anaerotruncus colihominis TaxID=169435 RepID=A0A845QHC6_9FIRM|nr:MULTISPECIES: sigma-70 family RNA polymerase sigma factor [Clostridia]MCI9475520.1 sigma-70 family RNA polymerase sigma factor [Emergencia sp.]MCI9641111.1 sigma-70 family RNA polymerase sigma factor [Emergencia sp.]NBH61299.1 sigma-70 family RNA polymerase sigma factor [Anaerotruncus colihominis]NCE98598.1 sigma-70 family RNA polymerase sigma factor [Emergencia sp. 1XD21-10]NCF01954.1 sigma-70 family RNA polymerase sigma factor [Anaerotruncus sp. 80]